MTLDIVTIPCRSDNYAYLLHDGDSGDTAVVDVPEAAPILAELSERGWKLGQILITHHHGDHVEGVDEVKAATGAKVVGAKADAHRLPPLDTEVAEGDRVHVGAYDGDVIDVSGHTVGHIAFFFPEAKAAFTADSLMALGCGRVFEGTPEMMWNSLGKLAELPGDTMVYSGHEYTMTNARFALTIDPTNPSLNDRAHAVTAMRNEGKPTVPSSIAEERATNPFLRAGDRGIKSWLGMENASDAEVFAEIRARKDNF